MHDGCEGGDVPAGAELDQNYGRGGEAARGGRGVAMAGIRCQEQGGLKEGAERKAAL